VIVSEWRSPNLCSASDASLAPHPVIGRGPIIQRNRPSEAELHLLRARLRGGVLAKARTGELICPLPVGLVYDPAGRVVDDPDQGVRDAVAHLFATFTRTGSARATVKAFANEGLRFPSRVQTGPNKGTLAWLPLRHHRALQILHNPRYAGAFTYGRRRQRRTPDGRMRHTVQPRESWTALIPDAHPGYISWHSYEDNQRILAAAAQARGQDRRASPPREGPAATRPGHLRPLRQPDDRALPHPRPGHLPRVYVCGRKGIEQATPACQSVPGEGLDTAIGQLLLDTVTPLALEVALTVQAELEARAVDADQLRRCQVERARHAAEQARRRYLAVDPDNRLVAANLEADWNDALRALTAAQEDYERRSANATPLSERDKERIAALAADFPGLWNDKRTPQRERKRMVRLLITDVTLHRGEQITAHVRLTGGQHTTLTLPLPLPAPDLRRTPAEVIGEVDRLLDQHTDAGVADRSTPLASCPARDSRSTPA
jgi:Recombinase